MVSPDPGAMSLISIAIRQTLDNGFGVPFSTLKKVCHDEPGFFPARVRGDGPGHCGKFLALWSNGGNDGAGID